jgi:hypothetical protein
MTTTPDQRWWRRKLPATWGSFWLLMVVAAAGVILAVTTHGLTHTLGVALAGACVIVDVQLALVLRREKR